MICKECGIDKEDKKFRSYRLKDGTLRRMKVCNFCRSLRDYPRPDKTIRKLSKFSDLDLLRALEMRGHKVFFR